MIFKIKQWIKGLMAKHYRLAVWTHRGTLHNYEGATIEEINAKLAEYGINLHGYTWTLYKSGRFYLPEREVESNQRKEE